MPRAQGNLAVVDGSVRVRLAGSAHATGARHAAAGGLAAIVADTGGEHRKLLGQFH